jgi:hypothetical protein
MKILDNWGLGKSDKRNEEERFPAKWRMQFRDQDSGISVGTENHCNF